MSERIERLMRRLRRLFLALLVCAVAGEVAVRIRDAALGGTGSLYDHVAPAGSRFKMRPGVSVVVPERYGDIRYRFNRAGYRDGEPQPGRRIVVLGDSVSFGLGVAQESIWPEVLERSLESGGLVPSRVDNLAIWAYHTANEADALREDGLALRPDVVLLQFYMNDFSIPPPAVPGTPPVPPSLGQRLTALKNRVLYSSALYRRLHQAGAGLAYALSHDLRRRRFPGTLNDAEPRGQSAMLRATPDDGDVAAFRAIRAIRDLARDRGARFLLILSPDETQLFSARFDAINRRIAAFCRREEIALFDPLPVYRASPERLDLYYDGVHYSPQGHALLARLVAAELRRLGFVRKEEA
ncbi:MAG TPA: hypothetical protein DD490_33150 [Acidobacteria bacterium]|nr:hypothetical protein [Acidobacteriota bacterium]